MVGRIERSADFERVLAMAPRARSAHFALHHLPSAPSRPSRAIKVPEPRQLSTGSAPLCSQPVDDSVAGVTVQPLTTGQWLGLVIPKRHARRAVTRTLIKRQVRSQMQSASASLPPGLWVVRLKAPFDRKLFPSAASDQLRCCARDELGLLFERALKDPQRPSRPRPREADPLPVTSPPPEGAAP